VQHHVDILQRRVESGGLVKRENTVVEMMLLREFFDSNSIPTGDDRL
jgi:hypothetical protein